MIPSQNEIQATCRKAARGAGYSWGMADEAGRACAWLWVHGVDSPAALAHLLTVREAGDDDVASCPLFLGAALCDSGAHKRVDLIAVHSPILLLSFLTELAKINDCGYSLSFGQAMYFADAHGMYCAAIDGSFKADCVIQPAKIGGEKMQKHPRRSVNAENWDLLNAFAHRTYAPATTASRIAGAGAGLSDND